MSEERGLVVDMEDYEKCSKAAQESSKGKAGSQEDILALDVHDINELKEKGFASTDDSPKYIYESETADESSKYKLAPARSWPSDTSRGLFRSLCLVRSVAFFWTSRTSCRGILDFLILCFIELVFMLNKEARSMMRGSW